jgi:hypothetical protein
MSDMRGPGAHLTPGARRQVVRATTVPGYRYRHWVLDSLRCIDVQDLATGGDHTSGLGGVYVDVPLVSLAPQQNSGQLAEDSSERYSIGELLDRRSRVVHRRRVQLVSVLLFVEHEVGH